VAVDEVEVEGVHQRPLLRPAEAFDQIAAMVGMSIEMVTKYSRYIDQRLAAIGTGAEQANAKSD
jgi:hypothetical protein